MPGLVDVTDAIDGFAVETVSRSRQAGAYVAGVWVPGAAAAADLQAVVQPVTGRARRLLPEGVRDSAALIVHVKPAGALRVDRAGTGNLADRVTYAGTVYVVTDATDYPGHGGGYVRAVLARVEA